MGKYGPEKLQIPTLFMQLQILYYSLRPNIRAMILQVVSLRTRELNTRYFQNFKVKF